METKKYHASMFPIRETISYAFFSNWTLGHEVQGTSIKHDFLNRTINITSFVMFASRNVSSYEISETGTFQKCRGSIVAISNGEYSHTSTKQVLINFRDFCLSSFLPIFSNAQGFESNTKDTEKCKKVVVKKLLHQ